MKFAKLFPLVFELLFLEFGFTFFLLFEFNFRKVLFFNLAGLNGLRVILFYNV